MTTEPEALRLAQDLKDYWEGMELHHVAALHRCAVVMLREQHAEIERLKAERLPAPPPECKTEAERNAYAFGFWSGVAAARKESER